MTLSFIPVGKVPYTDELMYSWIHRLAKANGLLIKDFLIEYAGMKKANNASLQADARGVFHKLYSKFLKKPDIISLFLSVNTFQFEAMFMTEGQQTKYINNAFSEKSNINTTSNGSFQQICICPKCVKNDIAKHGEVYLHRVHHLSGIKVCPEHHCTLMQFNGTNGHACDYNLEDYTEFNTVLLSDHAYADYASTLFNARVTTDIKTLKSILYTTLKEYGYSVSDGYVSLENDLHNWEYSDLISVDIPHFLKVKMINAEYISPEEVLPFFMFLYPDVDGLILVIKGEDSNPLLKKYHCDTCGLDYISTPFAEKNGFGCSFCKEEISDSAFVSKILETNGYSISTQFKSMNEKIDIVHHKCGEHSMITPRDFIYAGVRCVCESVISETEAKKTIKGLGKYELEEFISSEMPCRIIAKDCGHIFYTRYRKFVKSPYCRICFPKNMTTAHLRERIDKESNGEYELVSEFIDQDTKIQILHHVCGEITEYGPKYYHMGARCPICNNKFTDQWEKMYSLLLDYRKEHGNTNVPKRYVYKGNSLGIWCQHQRINFQGKKQTMTFDKIKKLSSIGFDFNPRETEWNRRYEQYIRYIGENGSYIQRGTDYEGEHLGAWVETQKKRFKAGKMCIERKEKLLKANPLFFTKSCKDS